MGLPIIGQVMDLVDSAIDKIWPDADTKEKAKTEMQAMIIKQAMVDKKLLFEDTAGARELFKVELETAKAPPWSRAFQVLARPFAMYSCVGMYVWVKVAPLFDGPVIELNEWDYYLIGTIFVFLFGARTLEKIKGKV
jgi:hypothetical protein